MLGRRNTGDIGVGKKLNWRNGRLGGLLVFWSLAFGMVDGAKRVAFSFTLLFFFFSFLLMHTGACVRSKQGDFFLLSLFGCLSTC